MPYKIYTYADPYRIAETDFWSEIHACPQLCSSRTLVNGMVDVMQDRIDALITSLGCTKELSRHPILIMVKLMGRISV